ncbi:hypothetical protein AB0D34_35665 [Streptomyces sp. NPDC048420]|uniref:hypothetical protein n=1 Tax=Streptomyces sp. NPDC048420 TaxID=3155755 RepID=UPI00341CEE2E
MEYFVLAAPVAGVWPCDARALLPPGALWWTTGELREAGGQVEPHVLPDLIDG